VAATTHRREGKQNTNILSTQRKAEKKPTTNPKYTICRNIISKLYN
jgi:hypothetical protein